MRKHRLRPRTGDRRRRSLALPLHVETMERRQLLATLIVNTAVDENDPTNPTLSLREAIEVVDGSLALSSLSASARAQITGSPSAPAQDYIGFDIAASGLQTISLGSALPAITSPVIIDGYSEPGASGNPQDKTEVDLATLTIQLDGTSAGANVSGLTINSANCIVAGLEITNFSGNGVVISGADSQGNWLEGNFIGTAPDPVNGRDFTPGLGNGGSGLLIMSSNNRVGGNNPSLRNVISGNTVGVTITSATGTGNLLQNNFILDNAQQGVLVSSSNNTIGEALKGGGNVISGNGTQGVEITGGAGIQGNTIVGNEIGTDIGFGTGASAIPRGIDPRPNGSQGILIEDSPNNTIGSLIADGKNVIAANLSHGILIEGGNATGNRVLNNWIGFNIVNNLESLNIPNLDGILITSSDNVIGGSTSTAANVIDHNLRHGIELSGPGATDNVIQGNIIGLNPGGGSDFGNTLDGIHIVDAGGNLIGGSDSGSRNTISGNNNGIVIINTGANGPSAASANLVMGNFIGTGVDGVSDLGNSVDGIVLQDAPGNTIGGTASGAGNVIAGNNRGLRITGGGSTGNQVQGNFIGTDLSGTAAIHNKIDGILLTAGASSNTIGGLIAGAGNTIAFNAGNGIRVESGTGNTFLSNNIYSNNQIGINLVGGTEDGFGVTANSPGGPHAGPNDLQNYPVLSMVAPNGSATFVKGTFNSTPNTTFTIQFFSSLTQDASGFGQGQTPIGTTTLRTDASGNASFAINLPTTVAVGRFVTATATDSSNNTSEFSNAVASVLTLLPSANPATIFVTTDLDENDPTNGTISLREAIELTDGTLQLSALSPTAQGFVFGTPNGTGQDSIEFAIPGTGLHTIFPTTPLPAITHAVNIDGLSQGGAALSPSDKPDADLETISVQIDGSSAGAGANGLTINAANCVIDALEITNFAGNGIEISGANAQGNWLLGNFIGTGTDPVTGRDFPSGLGNAGSGILITSSNNRIGGDTPGLRNVIYGNGVGLTITGSGGSGNLIQGNFILTNVRQGVLVSASNNTIGEAQKGGGNDISGNGQQGIEVTGGAGVQGNTIVGNNIGTEVGTGFRGLSPRQNNAEGILIENSPNNTIGGLSADAKNVVAANGADGILIDGANATGNRVLNNWIGFNIINNLESLNIPNNFDGIRITSAGNVIGGTSGAAANVVALNRKHGIELSGPGANGNVIQGNLLGLNPGGGSDFGNTLDGIHIEDAANNVIGGTDAGARNVISGNNNGVVIINTGANGPGAATGNLIQGNFIGTAVDGITDLGNSVDGVILQDAPRNTIGGTDSGAGNVIAGNNRGIRITGAGSQGNLVQGNFIGTDLTGLNAIHNKVDGVLITGGASSNTVGGLDAGAANVIEFNVGNGVRVESGTANAILSNNISSNNQIGINLVGGTEDAFGVTANSPGGPHSGPNNLQNYPVLTTVAPNGNSTFVQGTFNSTPNTTFTIQFFSALAKDPSGFGQGRALIGSTSVTTDGTGNATFANNVPIVVPSGQFVSATATDPSGNTSEFSNTLPSVPVTIQFSSSSYTINEAAGTATITITRSGGTGGAVAITFATSDGTATAGTDYTATSGSVFFNANETTKTVTIPITDDNLVESNETINLTLTDPTNGATLGSPSTATLTIVDNDLASVQFSAASYVVNENAGTATITVNRNTGNGSETVAYATSNGSAVAGSNYKSASGVLTFNPGETSKTFTVPVIDDNLVGGDGTVNLALSNPSGGTLGSPSTAVLTIKETDKPGSLRFSSPSYSVDESTGKATLTVSRVGGQGGQVSVFFATGGGTATPGVDYRPVSGTLIFKPGETRKTITIPLLADKKADGNETVSVVLSSPTGGATLGSPSSTTLILRDAGTQQPSGPGVNPNPNVPGPIVTDLHLVLGARGVTGILLSFNEALDPTRAQNVASYGFFVVQAGADGYFGTSDDVSVPIARAAYNPATHQVLLTPAVALPLDSFSSLTINGTPSNSAGITDVSGNLLDGDANGFAGGAYRVSFGLGTRFIYSDGNGDLVALRLANGGLMELRRGPSGEAQQLRLELTVPRRSILSGHTEVPPKGDGRTSIPRLLGAAGVKIQLTRSIHVGQVSTRGAHTPAGPRALKARHR